MQYFIACVQEKFFKFTKNNNNINEKNEKCFDNTYNNKKTRNTWVEDSNAHQHYVFEEKLQ